jgi:hypothetical protein
MTFLTEAYIRRKKFEGAAMLSALSDGKKTGNEHISPDAMLMNMGGF